MKNFGLIGLVLMLAAVFGGFVLYKATMPEEIKNDLIPASDEAASVGGQFLQLQPSTLPPVAEREEREETSEDQAEPKDSQEQGVESSGQQPQSGQVSGAEDTKVEVEGSQSVSEVDEPGVMVSMTDLGFFPASISVKAGTYVSFVNDGQAPHWPASGPHPEHDSLPGFDAAGELVTGESYSYRFTKEGEWFFHDHLNPDFRGSIIVE